MVKKFAIILAIVLPIFTFVIYTIFSESNDTEVKIEAYMMNSMSHEEGTYKKVNSVIEIDSKDPKNYIEVQMIEDIYDEKDQYIKTKVIQSTQKGEQEKTLNEETTLFLPDQFEFNDGHRFPIGESLTADEKAQVQELIEEEIDF
ncbi:hypothetical protein CEY16_12940 [Halalkalibacillus sediminis]|uniref:Uncharacterized protein n=1 Tax=Halalkalibacillus sediminis TaxID=2018042 RepID=A0A2I0QQX1_9BACI|nr:hypothetical protein [Halalkalibacillus sediminis]PKR76719.1 hypothetical protein CEY16_12940 [Halalkalibacillus sediminis]